MNGKELAEKLGISEAAVSFALNNKPGVSAKTRNRVKEAAAQYGMDLTKFASAPTMNNIYLFYYKKHGAVLMDTSFFGELTEGIEQACSAAGYRVYTVNIHRPDDLQTQIEEVSNLNAAGIIIFGTEMQQEDFHALAFARIPLILLDNHFISAKTDSVRINNTDGAYTATNYLISKRKTQPGYLHSAYQINNFSERHDGFNRALRHNGMSPSQSIIHELTPSIDGAYSDMLQYLKKGEPIAQSYFADNDLIAIGAMRALKEMGYQIPRDVAIIGFDDIAMCNHTEPELTSVHVPKQYMGYMAVERLLSVIGKKDYYPVNIGISTNLVIRKSV